MVQAALLTIGGIIIFLYADIRITLGLTCIIIALLA